MPLAEAFTPECIGFPSRQNCFPVQTVNREESWVPAHGDYSGTLGGLCGSINGRKVFRDFIVSVKAVYRIEQCSQGRALLRQISLGAAAENKHVYLVAKLRYILEWIHLSIGVHGCDAARVATTEDSDQFQILTQC